MCPTNQGSIVSRTQSLDRFVDSLHTATEMPISSSDRSVVFCSFSSPYDLDWLSVVIPITSVIVHIQLVLVLDIPVLGKWRNGHFRLSPIAFLDILDSFW